jgi:hypothetical protein
MKDKKTDLTDRLGDAAKARQALLERARAMSPANNPDFAKQQAERLAASVAREAREAERRAAKAAEKERLATAAREAEAAAQAAALEEQAARERAIAEAAARKIATEAELKAARDARYAARKAAAKRR